MEIPQYANAKGGGKDRHEIRFLGIELKTLGKIMQKKLDKSNLCLQKSAKLLDAFSSEELKNLIILFNTVNRNTSR